MNSNNTNTQQITFWNFLNQHTLAIPIIQRDYAQGRIGKEKLREKFLNDLKDALDSTLPNNDKVLKLDFVYGSVENERLNPLDGQQRLTTLWLLHWYIAYKVEKLNENKTVFEKFTYETRISSREFCEKLSSFSKQQPADVILVKHIQNQTWFLSAWKQDPTIQAMLNMLDDIEVIFTNCDKEKYEHYWEIFTGNNCPIIFYYLDLYGVGLSDDLYIKMNARGKSLTSFENFKADFIGFIKNKNDINNEYWNSENLKKIEHKLDTDWTDIFWGNRSKEHKIDKIYLAFFNRYFFNALITAKNDNNDYLFKGDDWAKSNKYYQFFNGEDCNKYSAYEMYNPKDYDKKEIFAQDFYLKLSNTLDNFYFSFKDKSKEDMKSP